MKLIKKPTKYFYLYPILIYITILHIQINCDIYFNKNKNLYLYSYNRYSRKLKQSTKEPKSLKEKIRMITLLDNTRNKTFLTNKIASHDYIKDKLGESHLPKIYGIWDNFKEIDFSKLPSKFVLKCSHGCGFNIIVKNKTELDIKNAEKKINYWMSIYYAGIELHYWDVKRKIFAEEYLDNLTEFKIFYSRGKFLFYDRIIRKDNNNKELRVFDNKYQIITALHYNKNNDNKFVFNKNFINMINLNKQLSKNYDFVRIDYNYLPDGRFMFSEITFTPSGGGINWAMNITSNQNYHFGEFVGIHKKKMIACLSCVN